MRPVDPSRGLPEDGRMGGPYRKSFHEPDESIRFEGIAEEIVEIAGFTVSRTVQQPGWRWSLNDPRALTEGTWCQAHHVGVVLAGKWGAELQDGTLLEWGPDDVFDCPPGHDGYTVGDEPCLLIEWVGVRTFIAPQTGSADRFLTTLVFTDLVDSTSTLAQLGDTAWHDVLSEHYQVARGELERFGGKEIETTGDGLLATFDAPARALRCAAAVRDAALRQGLSIRAGVHVGEVGVTEGGIRGVAVHEAARIMAAAGAGEILVSEIARALAAPTGLAFEDRGSHELKGLSDPHHLYAYLGST
jgi:class 3 adenylate cyclase